MITLALWLTVTIRRNGFIGYALASGLQRDGCRCENLPSRSFYLRANAIFSLLIIRDCKAIGDAGNISPRVPSTSTQNAIFSLLNIHIIPRRQIHVAIDNPSFVPSVSCLTTSSYL